MMSPYSSTTHSPYVISRLPEARVITVSKDGSGRTLVSNACSGDEPLSGSLGGLFRSSLLTGFLDRAARSIDGEKAILLVEGETDRNWLILAAERAGRPELLEGLTIVAASDDAATGSGGATMAATHALVLASTSDKPVGILLDNDQDGKGAQQFFKQVNEKTKTWKPSKRVFNYSAVFNPGNKHFEYEAEDLWPDELHEQFLGMPGHDAYLSEKVARPNPTGGYHYGYKSIGKPDFAQFLETEVDAEHCDRWIDMLEQIRTGFGI